MIEDEVGGGLRLRDRGSVQLKGHGPILVICTPRSLLSSSSVR
jgi:hypothetical protein